MFLLFPPPPLLFPPCCKGEQQSKLAFTKSFRILPQRGLSGKLVCLLAHTAVACIL